MKRTAQVSVASSAGSALACFTSEPPSATKQEMAAEMGAQSAVKRDRKHAPALPSQVMPKQRLTVEVKLLDPPIWFAGVAELYAEGKTAALKAIAAKAKEDKTAIISIAWRAAHGKLASSVLNTLVKEVEADWRSHKANWEQGKHRATPSSIARNRFTVHNKNIAVYPECDEIELKVRRRSGEWARLKYQCGEWQRERLRGALRFCETEIARRPDGTWYARISIEIPLPESEGSSIAAIHFGQKRLISALALDTKLQFETYTLSGSGYWRFRRKWKGLRTHLRKRKLPRIIKRIGGAERRWANWYFHGHAQEVTRWLIQQKVGLVILGAHRRLRDNAKPGSPQARFALHMWGWRSLADRIVYKLRLAGIEVFQVDEGKLKISSVCSQCGEEVDFEAGEITCRCGYRVQTDWNKLRNLLAASGISQRIFRKPSPLFTDKTVCDKTRARFDEKLFGISDLRKRLQHWSLRRER